MTGRSPLAVGVGQFLQGIDDLKEGLSLARGEASLAEEDIVPPSPLMQKPAVLLATLLEHRDDRPDGRCFIPAPIATLQTRAHLLQSEALAVLDTLVQQKLIQKVGNWESALVLQTTPVEPKQESITPAYKPPSIPSPIPIPKPEKRRVDEIEWVKLYAQLKTRAVLIGTELLLRGAVLVLQSLARIKDDEAIRRLEWLRDNGHLEQRDGWRLVVLLSDPVEQPAVSSAPEKPQKAVVPPDSQQVPLPRPPRPPRRLPLRPRRIAATRTILLATPLEGDPDRVRSNPAPGFDDLVTRTISSLQQEITNLQQHRESIDARLREAQEKFVALQAAEADYKAAKERIRNLMSKNDDSRTQ